jgi:hypothetical protein
MRIRIKYLLIGITLFAGFIIIVYTFSKPKVSLIVEDESKPGKINKIAYVIVKSAFMNPSNILKKNAALFITNKEELDNDQQLFLAERRYSHLCGYDYDIQFWINPDSLLKETAINSRCDIYTYQPAKAHDQVAYYVHKLETAPTHFIYNLKLSVENEPEEVKNVFKNSGLNLFFIDGASKRLPSLYLYYDYSENVIQDSLIEHSTRKIQNIIEKINSNFKLLNQSAIFFDHFNTNYVGGGLNLEFAKGSDLEKVAKIINNEKGAKAIEIKKPISYYVQLIDTSSNIENIKLKLKGYKIIKGISEYSK